MSKFILQMSKSQGGSRKGKKQEYRRPRLNTLRLSSKKNLTGQAGVRRQNKNLYHDLPAIASRSGEAGGNRENRENTKRTFYLTERAGSQSLAKKRISNIEFRQMVDLLNGQIGGFSFLELSGYCQ